MKTWTLPRRSAFTLVETMSAVAVFSLVTGAFLSLFSTSLTLTMKNVSLNDSNSELQNCFNQMANRLEGAALLVDVADYTPASQTFAAVADGTWGNAVRFMVPVPAATTYVLPDDNSGYTMDNPAPSTRLSFLQSGSKVVKVNFNGTLYSLANVPAAARLYPAFPTTTENVSTGSSPGDKPGLGIASVSVTTGGVALSAATITLTNAMTTARNHSVSDCTRAYFIMEAALAFVPEVPGGPRRLLYFPDTSRPGTAVELSRSLDAANQVPPPPYVGPAVAGNFCRPSGVNGVRVMLPIRSRDYSNALLRRGNGTTAAADTNLWIRLDPQFRLRTNL